MSCSYSKICWVFCTWTYLAHVLKETVHAKVYIFTLFIYLKQLSQDIICSAVLHQNGLKDAAMRFRMFAVYDSES